MDKLVVVRRDGTVERWSLATFEREATGELNLKVPPVAVAMGSASNGPLVVSGVDWPRLGETAFFDVLTMNRIEMLFHPHGFFNTSPNVYLRASADGRTFACVPDGFDGNTQTCVWSGGRVRKYFGQGGSFPVPGPDGRTLYSSTGIFAVDVRPLAANGTPCLPAHHGPYYLTLPRPDGAGRGAVSVHLEGDDRPFASLPGVDLPAGRPAGDKDKLLRDRRVHLIPDAHLFVTIPPGNDRLVLRRFDPEQALEASGLDYLAITSRAPTQATRGANYTYRLAVKAKKGVSYQVTSGPRGATIDGAGQLTWPVPADFPDHEAEIVVAVRDAGGREVRHGFRVDVAEPGPPFEVDPQLTGDWSKVYLTDMTPFDVKNGPWELGRGNVGNPTHDAIVLRGTRSPHGLGMHPPWGGQAAAKYVLGGRASTFRASAGLQDRPANEPAPSPITFLVFGDGRLLWQSHVVSARGASEDCAVDVRGVKVLELRTDAKGSSFGSHAVWFEPHLLKGAPPAGARPDLLPGDRSPSQPPGK
jgi:hypothetical protein